MLDLDSINVLQIGGENYFISNADDFIDLIRNKLGNDAADYVMAINNQVSEREEDLQYEVEDLQRDINYLESDIDDLKGDKSELEAQVEGRDEEIEALQCDIKDFEDKIYDLECKNDDLENKIDQMEAIITEKVYCMKSKIRDIVSDNCLHLINLIF